MASSTAQRHRGNALFSQGQYDQAITAYEEALRIQSDDVVARENLGVCLLMTGRAGEAAQRLRQVVEGGHANAGTFVNLGAALLQLGGLDEAQEVLEKAIAVEPNNCNALQNLGHVRLNGNQYERALELYRRALAINPADPGVHTSVGAALMEMDRLAPAVEAFRRALAIDRRYVAAHIDLGRALLAQGLADEAISAYRSAVELAPAFPGAYSALLMTVHYSSAWGAAEIFAEHRRWAALVAQPLELSVAPHVNMPSPDRRLRIGYVSPDFSDHPVGRFIEPILCNHDHDEFHITCYGDVRKADAITEHLSKLADAWNIVAGLSDAELAGKIRADATDILVDLTGHTGLNRLLAFARHPAPVQMTYLGYPDTTGLKSIDYRVTDAQADPPGMTEHLHSERLIRLPRIAWCYPAPCPSPAVADCPCASGSAVTFGSFNALPKLSPHTIEMWSRLLRAVPEARLLVKAKGLGEDATARRLRDDFIAGGVAGERVELLRYAAGHEQHLQLYNRVDIALDSFPYQGTMTTCEALWMGVPVVTLAGQTHVSRVGASILSAIGLEDLIATTPEQYVQIAAALARARPRLAELRSGMRRRMLSSPIMDGRTFTTELEAIYRRIWRQWCAKAAAR